MGTSVDVAVGVGIGVGLPVVLTVVVLVWFTVTHNRKMKEEDEKHKDIDINNDDDLFLPQYTTQLADKADSNTYLPPSIHANTQSLYHTPTLGSQGRRESLGSLGSAAFSGYSGPLGPNGAPGPMGSQVSLNSQTSYAPHMQNYNSPGAGPFRDPTQVGAGLRNINPNMNEYNDLAYTPDFDIEGASQEDLSKRLFSIYGSSPAYASTERLRAPSAFDAYSINSQKYSPFGTPPRAVRSNTSETSITSRTFKTTASDTADSSLTTSTNSPEENKNVDVEVVSVTSDQ